MFIAILNVLVCICIHMYVALDVNMRFRVNYGGYCEKASIVYIYIYIYICIYEYSPGNLDFNYLPCSIILYEYGQKCSHSMSPNFGETGGA